MARQKVKPYKRSPIPNSPDSMKQFLDNELRRLQEALASQQAAIEQIQAASSLPIPP